MSDDVTSVGDDIVIRRSTIYINRREVMIAAWGILRRELMSMSEAELRRGRRIRVLLRFLSPRTHNQQEAEFVVGGYPRENWSQTAIEREIEGALVAGAI